MLALCLMARKQTRILGFEAKASCCTNGCRDHEFGRNLTRHGYEKHRDFFFERYRMQEERKGRALTKVQYACQKETSDTLRVLMKIAQCKERNTWVPMVDQWALPTSATYLARNPYCTHSLLPVNEVSASCAGGIILHLCGTASSPLDTSFAMHFTLKGLICLQVAPRWSMPSRIATSRPLSLLLWGLQKKRL